MKITRKQAIKDCKTLWLPVSDGRASGKYEAMALNPELATRYYKWGSCPLCAYAQGYCDDCPYYRQFRKTCGSKPTYFDSPKEFAANIMKLE